MSNANVPRSVGGSCGEGRAAGRGTDQIFAFYSLVRAGVIFGKRYLPVRQPWDPRLIVFSDRWSFVSPRGPVFSVFPRYKETENRRATPNAHLCVSITTDIRADRAGTVLWLGLDALSIDGDVFEGDFS